MVCVIDSGFGHLSKLCAADAAGLRFVVPLRADTGWAQWFAADVPDGLDALARLDIPTATAAARTGPHRVDGVLREQVLDDHTGAIHRLRIAYIWSSEEAASVAEPATAPWPPPKTRSPESATVSAGATTRPKNRSTTGSPTSSDTASPT